MRSEDLPEAFLAERGEFQWTARDLLMELGSKSAFAQKLSGTSDKKSKEYKAALRNVERYTTEGKQKRTASKATKEKFNQIAKEKKLKPPTPAGGIDITVNGTIGVNGTGKAYERDRTIDLHISEDEYDEFARMAEEGDVSGMWDALADGYGVDSIDLVNGDIEIMEV